jgi:integrase
MATPPEGPHTAAYGRAAFAWAVARRGAHQSVCGLAGQEGHGQAARAARPEIAEIWHAASEAASPCGTIIRLLILTGQRRGEVAGMTWSELSEDLAIWTLPGERTKNGTAHTVPLSAPARDLLRALLPDHENKRRANGGLLCRAQWALPLQDGRRPSALDKAIRDTCAKGTAITGTSPARLVPWNEHDLRRTVATGLQRVGVRLEVTEAVLNHVSGSRGRTIGHPKHAPRSNLQAALALTEGGFIVEAKVIARCCFENLYWVGALVNGVQPWLGTPRSLRC